MKTIEDELWKTDLLWHLTFFSFVKGSRWTLQATNMDGNFVGYFLLPLFLMNIYFSDQFYLS